MSTVHKSEAERTVQFIVVHATGTSLAGAIVLSKGKLTALSMDEIYE